MAANVIFSSTAITPDGIITYADQLSSEFKKKYVLTGGPGFGKTDILKFIGSSGQKKGFFIEYMHDPFVPERIEHIFIPELSTCIISIMKLTKLIILVLNIIYLTTLNLIYHLQKLTI